MESNSPHPLRLGLTGTVACGKTTVAGMLRRRGFEAVICDEIVRDLLRLDQEVIDAVRDAFGPSVLSTDGTVFRAALAKLVFSDQDLLHTLEDILHPRVHRIWSDALAGNLTPIVVEIPLLFEKNYQKRFDFTLCVACDAATQAHRLKLRGWSSHDRDQRLQFQLPLAHKVERADFVIHNNASLDSLEQQVDLLLAQILHPSSSRP